MARYGHHIRPRTPLLVAVVSCLALTACGSDEESDSTASGDSEQLGSVTLASPPGLYNSLPVLVAEEEGIFADHGVEIEPLEMSGGGTLISAVASGSADVGMNISPQLVGIAVQQGQDIAFFCGQSPRFFGDLLAAPDSDLPTVEEAGSYEEVLQALEGRTVGVIALGGVADRAFQGALTEAGVDPAEVPLVAVGAGPAAVTAFETGQVDVLYGYPFVTQRLIAEDKAKMLVDLAAEAPLFQDLYGSGFIAQRQWIEENGDLAQALCDAYGEGIDAMEDPANAETVNGLLTSQFQLEGEETLDAARELLNGVLTTEISEDQMNATYRVSAEVGAMPAEPELSYDNTVLLPNSD